MFSKIRISEFRSRSLPRHASTVDEIEAMQKQTYDEGLRKVKGCIAKFKKVRQGYEEMCRYCKKRRRVCQSSAILSQPFKALDAEVEKSWLGGYGYCYK
jgi:hypothetical protein